MRAIYRDGSRSRSVEVTTEGQGRYQVTVDDAPFSIGAERLADGRLQLTTADGVVVAEVTAAGARRFVRLGALDFVLEREAGARRARGEAGGGLEAPMPGVVTRVMVAAGDAVTRGQPLVAVEAMKMEHLVRAPRDGRVASVRVRAGEMVGAGQTVAELDAEA